MTVQPSQRPRVAWREDAVLITPTGQIRSYHAHIYFVDTAQRQRAAAIREQLAEHFEAKLGRWHEQPIGPHERPMYQVAFAVSVFATLVPWLMLNRQDLAVLVHPNTGQPRRDHLVHALWLGEKLQIVRPEQLLEQITDLDE